MQTLSHSERRDGARVGRHERERANEGETVSERKTGRDGEREQKSAERNKKTEERTY